MRDELERYRAAGMDDCLVKPITRGGLSAAIDGHEMLLPVDGNPDAPLDRGTLDELQSHLGAEALDSLLMRFVCEGDAALARIDIGVDLDEVQRLAHRLNGSASTFGAHHFARQLSRLETQIKQGRPASWAAEDLRASWAEARAAVEATRAAIRAGAT